MGIATTMVVDYGDFVYQYTPRQYWVDVQDGNRLLAGGPRVNTYDMEYFRLDLQYWEIKKKEVSGGDNWQTLYFRKRQPKIIDSAEWNVEKTRFSYPGYGKDALIFTEKNS